MSIRSTYVTKSNTSCTCCVPGRSFGSQYTQLHRYNTNWRAIPPLFWGFCRCCCFGDNTRSWDLRSVCDLQKMCDWKHLCWFLSECYDPFFVIKTWLYFLVWLQGVVEGVICALRHFEKWKCLQRQAFRCLKGLSFYLLGITGIKKKEQHSGFYAM